MTLLSLFLALAFTTTPSADVPPTPVKNSPDISSPQPVIDIGDVFQGESKSTTFVIENKGTAELGLLRVVPKCGCTIPTLRLPDTGEEMKIPMIVGDRPFLTLAPGKKCEINVTFNSAGQGGNEITKPIHVESNDPDTPSYELTLKINLKRIAFYEPQAVQLGSVTIGDTKQATITVRPGPGVSFDIAKIAPVEHLAFETQDSAMADGRKEFAITVTLLSSAPIGAFNRTLQIETSIPTAPKIKIPIFADVKPAIRIDTGNPFNSSMLDLGVMKPGEAHRKTFEITNLRPERPYAPTSIEIDSTVAKQLKATFESADGGTKILVTLEIDATLSQKFFKGTLKIHSEHSEARLIEVPFQGLMKP